MSEHTCGECKWWSIHLSGYPDDVSVCVIYGDKCRRDNLVNNEYGFCPAFDDGFEARRNAEFIEKVRELVEAADLGWTVIKYEHPEYRKSADFIQAKMNAVLACPEMKEKEEPKHCKERKP